eukprot:TRINITY_DN1042_c0_g1_i1.p1 TRINITY_DN1042_c0_g1~~TRINITY_DN1042_c0_g1_i1.p1  ORF type:complete len:4224 (+),score=1358.75 TRINITY_DN1042_c0_g1_i1:274-12672(+)
MTDAEFQRLPFAVKLLRDSLDTAKALAQAEKPEQVPPIALQVAKRIEELADEQTCIVPAGWMGMTSSGWLMYIITRVGGNYVVTVANTGNGIEYHPSRGEAPKIMYRSCLSIPRVPARRIADPAFWLLSFLLMTKDPPSEYSRVEVVYDVLLPWLAEVTSDHPNSAGRPLPSKECEQMSTALSDALMLHTRAGGGEGAALGAAVDAACASEPRAATDADQLRSTLAEILSEAAQPVGRDSIEKSLRAVLAEAAPPGGGGVPMDTDMPLRTLGDAMREGAADIGARWRTSSRGGSSHYKSVWEATRYVLALRGVSAGALKSLSFVVRRELLLIACSEVLACLPPQSPLIGLAKEQHGVDFNPPTLSALSAPLRERQVRLFGPHGDGTCAPEDIASGAEVIGVLFAGAWCGPCQRFVPRLARQYEPLKERGLSVVFVSGDKSREEFDEHHSKMPWPAVPYNLAEPITRALGVQALPTVLLFNARDGTLITRDGTTALLRHGDTFPWAADRSFLRARASDDDLKLIGIGVEQTVHKALKEHKAGRLSDADLGRVHDLASVITRATHTMLLKDSEELPPADSRDLQIEPPDLRGDDIVPPPLALENGAEVSAEAAPGFSLFSQTGTRKFLGERLDLTAPAVTNLLEVPETVTTVDAALKAIETCERLCRELHGRARKSTTSNRVVLHLQIIAAVGDLFTSVVPVPRPADDPADCIWKAPFTEGVKAQKQALQKLHALTRLYATVWQSVESPTRAFDSERCLVVMAIMCVFDVTLRMAHGDDTLLLSTLMNEDEGKYIFTGLCIDGRRFDKVASRLELVRPHFTSTLSRAVAYLQKVEYNSTGGKRSAVLNLAMPYHIELQKYGDTCDFVRVLVVRSGLPLIPEALQSQQPSEMDALLHYLCEPHSALAEQQPEWIYVRDMAALYRFLATMETRDTELLRRRKIDRIGHWRLSFDDNLGSRRMWMDRDSSELLWEERGVRGVDLHIADLGVKAFNDRELRWGEGPVVQSPADVDRILRQENVTEDDVLHADKLPTYGDTLSHEEAELMMTVLTTRYMSIPLVLDFFSSMDRHTYLFNQSMQDLLRAVVFEPGPWAPEGVATDAPHVPLRQSALQRKEAAVASAYDVRFKDHNESLLGTPYGLLLNELRYAPHAVLQPVLKILDVSLKDLGTCSVYSANANYICFILDFALDLQTYVAHAERMEGLLPDAEQELRSGGRELARVLQVFAGVVDSWKKEAEDSQDMSSASVAHSFRALIAQTDPDKEACVRGIVASLAYTRNWHGFGLGRLRSDILASSDEGGAGGSLTPEQRLLRFLQAQGIQTQYMPKNSLEKYISTGGRNRPLFLHIGNECVRIPTLVRCSAASLTEGGAQTGKLPPWDLPEAKLLALLQSQRRRIVEFLASCSPATRDSILNDVVRAALRTPDFHTAGWTGSADTGSRYAAKEAELAVDIQGCEVLWRNDDLKPVPDSMTQFPDFETIFGKEALHCGLVQRSTHRHWVHVVGTEYDLAEWTEPSPSEIGAGCPVPTPTGDAASEALARQLQREEAPQHHGMRGMFGAERTEPYVAVEDVTFEGVRYTRPLDPYGEDEHVQPQEGWAVDLVKEVLNAIYPKDREPMKWTMYMPDKALERDCQHTTFLGCDGPTNENLTWKLLEVRRDPPVVDAWMLLSHGRRIYRSLLFSTNARTSVHNLSPNPDRAFSSPLMRYAAGDMKKRRVHGPSLVITRMNSKVGCRETYLPPILLQGLIPSALLESFLMWLGVDGVIRAEPVAANSQWFEYALEIRLRNGTAEIRRRAQGHCPVVAQADGGMPRQDTPEAMDVNPSDLEALKEVSAGYGEPACRLALQTCGGDLERAAEWLFDDSNCQAILEATTFEASRVSQCGSAPGADDEDLPRSSSLGMAVRAVGGAAAEGQKEKDLLAHLPVLLDDGFGEVAASHALRAFGGDPDAARAWLTDEQNAKKIAQLELEPATATPHRDFDDSLDLHCLNLRTGGDSVLRALATVLSGVDDLSHVLVWGMPAGSSQAWKISVVELPRLRLKLQPQRDGDKWQMRLIDHPGWFLANAPPHIAVLLRGLPEYAVVSNQAGHFRVIVPNHDVARPKIPGVAFPSRLIPVRSSLGWEEVMDQRFYTYSVHVSGSFLVTPGLGPTLYLVLLRLLTRRYGDAFLLIQGVCTDTELGADEQWIFNQIDKSTEDRHPDAIACRLRLSLAVLYSPIQLPWALHAEMDQYLNVLAHVSASCTLTHAEELELIRRCSEGTARIKNRLSYLTSGSDGAETQVPSQRYPGQPWARLFMMGKGLIDAKCKRLQRICYRPLVGGERLPAALEDEKLTELLWNDMLLVDDEGGGGHGLGLGFFFHAIRGGVPMKVQGVDVTANLTELLLRWVHLRHARWGKEAVDEGETEMRPSRHFVQLALMARFPERPWPVLNLETNERRFLRIGIELYKGQGRESLTRAWIDALDTEFLKCLADPTTQKHRAAAEAASSAHFRSPLSEKIRVIKQPQVKRRPPVTDSGCASRSTPKAVAGADDEVLTQPLRAVAASYITYKPAGMKVADELPFKVSGHPASAAPVAQDMLRRLGEDVRRYAAAVRAAEDPVLNGCTDEDVADIAGGAGWKKAQALIRQLDSLIRELDQLQRADSALVAKRTQDLLKDANAVPASARADVMAGRVQFSLERLARHHATVSFPHLCALFVSSKGEDDMAAANPFATGAATSLDSVAPVLLHANRIAHASDAMVKAVSLRDMMQRYAKAPAAAGAQGGRQFSGEGRQYSASGRQSSASEHMQQTELRMHQAASALAEVLTQRRWFVDGRDLDPRFLLFEFIFSIRLRRRQVEMVRWFVGNLRQGSSRVQQMIMGQGKTTCVAPLLVLLLADRSTLVTQVMPSALLQQTRSVLQSCFAAPILPKKIFTFLFDRSVEDSAENIVRLCAKLKDAAQDGGVVVSPPEAIKSFELKFIELLHSLDTTDLSRIRPSASSRHTKESERARNRLLARSGMADEMVSVLKLWRNGVLLMDEVDVLLHPLRSELNFPIGNKFAIDQAGPRWDLPLHLIDAIFAVSRKHTVDCLDKQWEIAFTRVRETKDSLLRAIGEAVEAGYARDALQASPHLILLDTDYYHSALKGPLSKWALVWIHRHLPEVDDLDPELALSHIAGRHPAALGQLRGDTAKLLHLAREWMQSLLPHVLSKIDRVGFGLLQETDMVYVDPNVTQSRMLTAVPFVGKDVPSRSSEFAHPDVVIGLTVLAFRYEGLRRADLRQVVTQLKKDWSRQHGPRDRRPASMLFASWLRLGADAQGGRADSVAPLPLFHANDTKQFDRLYGLVRLVPELIYYYLQQHVFPATMNFQRLKISACGHELGSSLLFGGRAGFSGTPSNLLPLDLGTCEYEPGSDGAIVHTLTDPAVTTAELKQRWTAKGLLRDIARAQPPFHALIDTGAYITNLDNQEVAEYLLQHLPEWFEGCVYLDKHDRKMVMFRSGRSVPQEQCGIAEGRRFTFYDQIHTTGMDIKQAPTARAVLTIGKDMTFRDYAQGAYRMRGIGKGQTLRLHIIQEVQTRIESELGTARTGRAEIDVPSWLLLNSMRMEALQAVKLGEQELQNIWRKTALAALVQDVAVRGDRPEGLRMRRFDAASSSTAPEEVEWMKTCVGQYRETISHTVPEHLPEGEADGGGFHDKLDEHVREMSSVFVKSDEDRRKIEQVCASIRRTAAAAQQDAKTLGFQAEVVHEQEAEQEQEQEAEQEEQKENRYSRDDEQHNPWQAEFLTRSLDTRTARECNTAESPFYFLSAFRAHTEMPSLPFPDALLLTDNFFRPSWLGLGERRLKSALMMLAWRATEADPVSIVLVSAAEAETLRWMVHSRHSAAQSAALIQLLTPSGMVVDSTGRFTPDQALLQCVRFFNGEMYFSDQQLDQLETALAAAPLEHRREFFLHSVRLRRRQQGLYADTPVARFLTPREEWHLIRARGRRDFIGEYLRNAVRKGGDIVTPFERQADDRGVCNAQQLRKALLSLSPGFSAGDCSDVVSLLSEGHDERQWTFADLCGAFRVSEDDARAARRRAESAVACAMDLDEDPSFWQCKQCTALNDQTETACTICGYGWTGQREPGKNEWVCPPELGGCSMFNPNALYYCSECNKARPDLATTKF